MSGWTLVRHKKDRDGRPAAVYWTRKTGERGEWRVPGAGPTRAYADWAVEIRSPLNAAGNGSESGGELLNPEGSARSGVFPATAINEHYEETTPEELGLTLQGATKV